MNQQNLNNSDVRAEQAASPKLQTLKLGLDVHAESIVVVRLLDHSAPQPAQKFTPAKFRAWIRTQLPLAAAVHTLVGVAPLRPPANYSCHLQTKHPLMPGFWTCHFDVFPASFPSVSARLAQW